MVVLQGVSMLFGKRHRVVKRILVVEDEPLTAFDNENLINDAGYDVVATVDSYDEAVAALDREPVDLILSDVKLAGEKSGIDLAAVARDRGVPILFVTGYAPAGAEQLVLGVLAKPYSDRALKAALKSVEACLSGEKVKPPKGLTLYCGD